MRPETFNYWQAVVFAKPNPTSKGFLASSLDDLAQVKDQHGAKGEISESIKQTNCPLSL
jgi:hypothetical protein